MGWDLTDLYSEPHKCKQTPPYTTKENKINKKEIKQKIKLKCQEHRIIHPLNYKNYSILIELLL